jgi:hypothetical protein
MEEKFTTQSIDERRNYGQSIPTRGFAEIIINNACISWVNTKLLEDCQRSKVDIIDESLFNLVHEKYAVKLAETISEIKRGVLFKKTLWPIVKSESVSWWMVKIEFSDEERIWISCHPVIRTDLSGNTFDNAKLLSEVLSDISTVLSTLGVSEDNTIEKLDVLSNDISDLKKDTKEAYIAIRAAEKAAKENKQAVEDLKKLMSDQLNKHTDEIITLMSSDVLHDKRIDAFESHINATTLKALNAITSQGASTKRQVLQKVTVPVGAITALLAFLQWLIIHYKL